MNQIHPEAHPQAGELVLGDGSPFQLEDWWDRGGGMSWTVATGNMAAFNYGMWAAAEGLPVDDEVVYGKVRGSGILVHVSEIAAPVAAGDDRD